MGFNVGRVREPVIKENADKVYLITHSDDTESARYVKKIQDTLHKKGKHLKIEHRRANMWDLFDCLKVYREIIEAEKRNHIYINVSTGSKVSAIAGTLACMIWKGVPYYTMIKYPVTYDRDGFPIEVVEEIVDLPVYSINHPRNETLHVLRALARHSGKLKKKDLIHILEEKNLIDADLSSAAKHSRLKGILHPISVMQNPLVQVEYKGRQSSVTLTPQGERTLKIFGIELQEIVPEGSAQ